MSASILHFSDIHPISGQDMAGLADGIVEALKGTHSVDFLVASGDLGFKGENQELGARFLIRIADMLNIPPERTICVPGNHDIQLDQALTHPFQGYSQAVFGLFQDSDRTEVKNACRYLYQDYDFLLINSAYRLEPSFGEVDHNAIVESIGQATLGEFKIAVVHHHAIPVAPEDRSAIVNSYEFLKLISDSNYDVLLHGHQHIAMSLRVGKHTVLAGVGSINYKPEENVNNQFNIIRLRDKIIRFRYFADSTKGPKLGAWHYDDTELW